MDANTVLSVLGQMIEIRPGQEEHALLLCENALSVLLPRVRPGADAEDSRIAFAAAADASRKLLLAGAAGDRMPVHFSAGDIRVTQNTAQALTAAQRLYEQAMADLAGLLCDDKFYCGRTGG